MPKLPQHRWVYTAYTVCVYEWTALECLPIVIYCDCLSICGSHSRFSASVLKPCVAAPSESELLSYVKCISGSWCKSSTSVHPAESPTVEQMWLWSGVLAEPRQAKIYSRAGHSRRQWVCFYCLSFLTLFCLCVSLFKENQTLSVLCLSHSPSLSLFLFDHTWLNSSDCYSAINQLYKSRARPRKIKCGGECFKESETVPIVLNMGVSMHLWTCMYCICACLTVSMN